MVKAILFDLDGTLLAHNFDDFLPRYLGLLREWFAELLPSIDILGPLMASIQAMMANDGSRTNQEAFWSDFGQRFHQSRAEVEPLFVDFFRKRFPLLNAGVSPNPMAISLVETCRARGVVTVLATNPVFPRQAIDERLRWAGLEGSQFDLVTSFETMRYCKPTVGYFQQIAAELATETASCLMVGNDVDLDLLPASLAGMKTCLITGPYQVNSVKGYMPDYSGALEGVLALLEREPRLPKDVG